jgi:hypothetical protein
VDVIMHRLPSETSGKQISRCISGFDLVSVIIGVAISFALFSTTNHRCENLLAIVYIVVVGVDLAGIVRLVIGRPEDRKATTRLTAGEKIWATHAALWPACLMMGFLAQPGTGTGILLVLFFVVTQLLFIVGTLVSFSIIASTSCIDAIGRISAIATSSLFVVEAVVCPLVV